MQGNGKTDAFQTGMPLIEIRSDSRLALENRLEVLTVLSNSILEEVESLRRAENIGRPGSIDLDAEVQHFETDLIKCALVRTGGNQRQACRLLNIKATTLNAKIKRYRINVNGLAHAEPVDDKHRRWAN